MMPSTAILNDQAGHPTIIRLPITIMFGAIVTIPTLLFYFSLSSSLALGSTIVALLVIFVAVSSPNRLRSPLLRSFGVIAVMVFCIVLHLAIASLLYPVDAGHAAASLAPLAIIVVGGTILGRALAMTSDRALDRAVKSIMWMMSLFVFAKLLGLRVPASRDFSNPVFPFTKPSHFVLLFMPFYLYICVTTTARRRLAMLALGLFMVVALESLTLAIGWVLVAVVCSRGWLVPLGIAALSAIVLTQVNLTYFLDRLDFSDETTNRSTLVYLQGWQLVEEALRATQGWGEGFQQLALQGTNSDISRVIFLILGKMRIFSTAALAWQN